MEPNGNLNYAERRALKAGDCVVYQTEAMAHRGEMAGTVSRVSEGGIVYIGKHGSRYALLTDFVRRADWMWTANHQQAPAPEDYVSASEKRESFLRDIAPTRDRIAQWPAWKRNALGPVPVAPSLPPMATPEPARGVASPDTGKDTDKAPDAPEGQEMASIDDMRSRVAALTAERDDARLKLKTMMLAVVALIETAREVCDE